MEFDPDSEFDFIERLGKGHFGEVWKVTYKKTGKILALKKIRIEQESQMAEITREINALKKCACPNVVKYYGSRLQDKIMWILMEFCPVGSVNDVMCMTNKTLNEEQVATICRGMLIGLDHMKNTRKVHRDIKPHNVLLDVRGEAKLADFGIARDLDENNPKRKTVIGTPYYLAPEVIKEIGYDNKADIWALGISAIEMAEKDPPYAELHPMRVLFLVANNPAPTFANPEMWSGEFKDFVTKCLQVNADNRPSAKELLSHPFIKKANPPSILPIIQAATAVIEANGGLEKALTNAKPAPAAEEDTIDGQDQSISDISASGASMTAGSMDMDFDGKGGNYIDESDSDQSDSEAEPDKGDIDLDDILGDLIDSPQPSPRVKEPKKTHKAKKPEQQVEKGEIDWDSLVGGLVSDEDGIRPAAPEPTPAATDVAVPPKVEEPLEDDWKDMIDDLLDDKADAPDVTPIPVAAPASTPIVAVESGQAPIDWAAMMKGLEGELSAVDKTSPPEPAVQPDPKPAIAPPISTIPANLRVEAKEFDDLLSQLEGVKPSGAQPNRLFKNVGTMAFRRQFPKATTISHEGRWFSPVVGEFAFRYNPQFIISISQPSQVLVTLKPAKHGIRTAFTVLQVRDKVHRFITLPSVGIHTETEFTTDPEVSMPVFLEDASFKYVIVARAESLSAVSSIGFELAVANGNTSSAFTLNPLPSLPDSTLTGQWTEKSSGGALNFNSWRANPQFLLKVKTQSDFHVFLTQVDETIHHAGLYITKAEDDGKKLIRMNKQRIVNQDTKFRKRNEIYSGKLTLSVGAYIIMPATFNPGHTGHFNLTILSDRDSNYHIEPVRESGSSFVNYLWAQDSAGGCMSYPTWVRNPKFHLNVTSASNVTITLERRTHKVLSKANSKKAVTREEPPFIGFYVFKGDASKATSITRSDIVFKTKQFQDSTEVLETASLSAGNYIVVPCSYHPGYVGDFSLVALSDREDTVALNILHLNCTVVSGAWNDSNCGGGFTHTSWRVNPQFFILPTENSDITVSLNCNLPDQTAPPPSDLLIGIAVAKLPVGFNGQKLMAMGAKDILSFSKYHMSSFATTSSVSLTKGQGCIAIPMTAQPGIKIPFEVAVTCTKPVRMAPLREDWHWKSQPGKWNKALNTVGGCMNFKSSWQLNPKFRFGIKAKTKLHIFLAQESASKVFTPAGFYLFVYTTDPLTKQHFMGKSEFAPLREIRSEYDLDPGVYMIIAAKFSQGEEGAFSMHLFASNDVLFAPLKQ